jgi:hypothetical protein
MGIMLGRILFALVSLIITAGVLLPVYPSDGEGRAIAAPDAALLLADDGSSGCQARMPGHSSCGQVQPTVGPSRGTTFGLTVYLIVRPLPSSPSSENQPLPPERPAI